MSEQQTALARIEQGQTALAQEARELQIVGPASEQTAADLMSRLDDMARQIHQVFDPTVAAAHQAHVTATQTRKALLDRVEEPLGIVKGKLGAWLTLKRQRQAEAEAAARREQERLRAEAAEQQRIADEAAAQENARRLAEAARLLEEQRLATAIEVESETGDSDLAEAVLEMQAEPDPVPLVVAERVAVPIVERPIEAPKAEGLGSRTSYKFRVVDDSQVPREYLVVDEKSIGAIVRARKGRITIPGVEIWEEQEAVRQAVNRTRGDYR